MNEDYLLDPAAIDGTPAHAFASHQTRVSAIAWQYALTHPLNFTDGTVADEDNTIQLIAHLQAASDDLNFFVQGYEPSRTLAPKMLRNLNQGHGQVGTSFDEGFPVGQRLGDYDMALKGLMVIAYRYRLLLSDDDLNFILDRLVPPYLVGSHDPALDSYPILTERAPETENHQLMINSTRYLVNQLLFDRTGDRKYDNGENGLTKWLLGYMHTIAKHDFLEFNSRPYQRLSLHALFNLHEFARDDSIRTGAQILLDYTMVKFAVSSNRQRRISPFRRLKENTNRPDNINDLLREKSGDPLTGFFLMYAGPTDRDGNPTNRFPAGWAIEAVIAGLAAYRPPPAAYILAMKRDNPAYQHRFHHGTRPVLPGTDDQADGGVEIYYRSPSFLLTAGGMFLNSGYGGDEFTGYEQTAIAQSTTLLPTRTDVGFADLIRFDPYPDERRAVNTGVHLGFACGANLRPSEKKIFNNSTTHAPTLGSNNKGLFLAWKGSGNQNLNAAKVYTTEELGIDGIEGFEGKVVLGDTSEEGPALASHNDRLFLAWKGAGNDNLNLMFSDDNGTTFHGKVAFPDTSHHAPALTSHGGRLFLAWTGRGDGNLNVAKVTFFGNTTGGFGIEGLEGKVVLGDTSEEGPALASHNDRLFLAWKGAGNDNLNLLSSRDGVFQAGPWYFSDLSELGFYVSAYRTPPAQPDALDTPLDSLGFLYAMEAGTMSFEKFEEETRARNTTLPAKLEYEGQYVFHTADDYRFTFWLHLSLEKYTVRIIRMDEPQPVFDFKSLPLVEGPYLKVPGGHDGLIEVRHPGCETAPLVLDYRDPQHPVRTENATACPQPWIDRHQALRDFAGHLLTRSHQAAAASNPAEGIDFARKAVATLRQLVPGADEAAIHWPFFAATVWILAMRLMEAGRMDDALGPASESVELCRRAAAVPGVDLHALCGQLLTLSHQLASGGRPEVAIEPAVAAVEILRGPASAPGAVPDLRALFAAALEGLARRLLDANRHEEALMPAEESLAICEQLVRDDPAKFQTQLAGIQQLVSQLRPA